MRHSNALAWAIGLYMCWLGLSLNAQTLIAYTCKDGTAASVTSDAIDTTGATLLVISASYYTSGADVLWSDSKTNTWTSAGTPVSSGNVKVAIRYADNPTVGSGHTFKLTGDGGSIYSSICVSAWSGMAVTDVLEAGTYSTASASSATQVQAGAITPSNTSLVIAVTGTTLTSGATASIDSGFTIASQVDGPTTFGQAHAYLVQAVGASVNPQWTWSSAGNITGTIVAFQGVATASPRRQTRILQ
jgi:hypothetical protein